MPPLNLRCAPPHAPERASAALGAGQSNTVLDPLEVWNELHQLEVHCSVGSTKGSSRERKVNTLVEGHSALCVMIMAICVIGNVWMMIAGGPPTSNTKSVCCLQLAQNFWVMVWMGLPYRHA